MTTLEISSAEETEALKQIDQSSICEAILSRWDALLVDTTGDAMSEGGQSIAELARLEQFGEYILTLPQTEAPLFHYFADGIYIRVMHAAKDSVVIGCEHHEESVNMMLAGEVLTIWNGRVEKIVAPWIGTCGKHTRKASIVLEDMMWATIHTNPTNERNIEKLDARLHIRQ